MCIGFFHLSTSNNQLVKASSTDFKLTLRYFKAEMGSALRSKRSYGVSILDRVRDDECRVLSHNSTRLLELTLLTSFLGRLFAVNYSYT